MHRGDQPRYKDKRKNLLPDFDASAGDVKNGAAEFESVEDEGEAAAAALNFKPYVVPHDRHNNVLPVETQAALEQAALRGTPIRQAAKELGVAQNTVGKYLDDVRARSSFDETIKAAAAGRLLYKDLVKRKPMAGVYPVEETAADILARPRFRDGMLLNNRTHWSAEDHQRATILAAAGADMAKAEIALGRPIKTIAWRMRDSGIKIPREWSKLITKAYVPRERVLPLMQFPYIAKARPEHADLLRVNELVPRAFNEDMRADIAQEVMLALFEGTVTMAELEKNRSSLTFFIKKFRKMQQPYQEMTGIGGPDDERSYEDIAISTKYEADENERREIRGTFQSSIFQHWQDATQLDAVYARQVGHAHWKLHNHGKIVSVREAAEELEAGTVKVWS